MFVNICDFRKPFTVNYERVCVWLNKSTMSDRTQTYLSSSAYLKSRLIYIQEGGFSSWYLTCFGVIKCCECGRSCIGGSAGSGDVHLYSLRQGIYVENHCGLSHSLAQRRQNARLFHLWESVRWHQELEEARATTRSAVEATTMCCVWQTVSDETLSAAPHRRQFPVSQVHNLWISASLVLRIGYCPRLVKSIRYGSGKSDVGLVVKRRSEFFRCPSVIRSKSENWCSSCWPADKPPFQTIHHEWETYVDL